MAGLLGSWWSGKQPEEEKTEGKEESGGAESEKGKGEGTEPSWVAGFEGNKRHNY